MLHLKALCHIILRWHTEILKIKLYISLEWVKVDYNYTLWLLLVCIHFIVCMFNINTLRPRQNGRHFADDTFKHIFLEENVRISIKISLKFVWRSPIDNIPALFQIMAWCRPGDKPLSEAMMLSLLMHICVARPQWVNKFHHIIPLHVHTPLSFKHILCWPKGWTGAQGGLAAI